MIFSCFHQFDRIYSYQIKTIYKPMKLNTLILLLTLTFNTTSYAQALKPELVNPPAGNSPRHSTYSLGKVSGLPTFAVVYRTGQEQSPVCSAHKLLVQADKGTNDISNTMQQVVIAFLAHCDGKILLDKQVPGLSPRLRSFMHVEQYDAEGVQLVVADARGTVGARSFMSRSIQFAELPNGSATLARAAQKVAQNEKQLAHHAALQPTYRANAQQLRQWFTQHNISGFVSVTDIARNPFTYEQKTVLTLAHFDRANSASEVRVSEPNGYYGDAMLLQNTQSRDWAEGSYLVIAQVLGRNTTETNTQAIAKDVQHFACKQFDCQDLLQIPDATGKLVSVFKFGMKP
jgi:hypothetical protein